MAAPGNQSSQIKTHQPQPDRYRAGDLPVPDGQFRRHDSALGRWPGSRRGNSRHSGDINSELCAASDLLAREQNLDQALLAGSILITSAPAPADHHLAPSG